MRGGVEGAAIAISHSGTGRRAGWRKEWTWCHSSEGPKGGSGGSEGRGEAKAEHSSHASIWGYAVTHLTSLPHERAARTAERAERAHRRDTGTYALVDVVRVLSLLLHPGDLNLVLTDLRVVVLQVLQRALAHTRLDAEVLLFRCLGHV